MLTAIVLTKNEEKNIFDCLETLTWVDEIVIVDDNSEDRTVEVAQNVIRKTQNVSLQIFKRNLNGDFAAQRNFALEKARGEWVLFVDADERVSLQLREEIRSVTSYRYPTVKGFFLKRIDKMWGRELRYGETANVRLLRLGMKDAGKWRRIIDEIWVTEGDTGELENPLMHLPHPTVTEFLESINFSSTLNSQQLYDEGKHTTFSDWFKPPLKFIQNWIFRRGFLDGMPGFTVALLMSLHSFFVRAKLYLLWKQGADWK